MQRKSSPHAVCTVPVQGWQLAIGIAGHTVLSTTAEEQSRAEQKKSMNLPCHATFPFTYIACPFYSTYVYLSHHTYIHRYLPS